MLRTWLSVVQISEHGATHAGHADSQTLPFSFASLRVVAHCDAHMRSYAYIAAPQSREWDSCQLLLVCPRESASDDNAVAESPHAGMQPLRDTAVQLLAVKPVNVGDVDEAGPLAGVSGGGAKWIVQRVYSPCFLPEATVPQWVSR